MPVGPVFALSGMVLLAIGWLYGEAVDKPCLRRICGPMFCVLAITVAVGLTVVRTSFSDSIRYSGATKKFVAAIVRAVDRGEEDEAHRELRRFDKQAFETYEGGAFLNWLQEPIERLEPTRSIGP